MKPTNATIDGPSPCQLADKAAIIGLTRQMSATWDTGDAAGYGRLFGRDSDYIAFDGTWLKGRDANIMHHRKLFETVLRGSRLVFEGQPSIRFVSPDLAVMHAMGSVLMPWQDDVTSARRSIQTYVVGRDGAAGWRIESFHNTRYRPRPLPGGLALTLIIAAMRLRTLGNAWRRLRGASRP